MCCDYELPLEEEQENTIEKEKKTQENKIRIKQIQLTS